MGKPVDLGPNWLHGDSPSNSLQEYYHKPGVTLHDIGEQNAIYTRDGRLLNTYERENIEGKMWEYVDRAISYSSLHSEIIDEKLGLLDFVEHEMDRDCVYDERQREQIRDAMVMFGFYIGEAATRQSLKFAYLEEMVPGETLFVASGYTGILNAVAEPALQSSWVKVKLASPVAIVRTVKGRVEISLEENRENEDVERFDWVVVAVPLGVLKGAEKKGGIKFEPEMPAGMKEAIKCLGYGRLEKVYIKFERAFWGDVDQIEFFSPEYTTQHWPMSALSLSQLPAAQAQNTLLFYTYGEISAFICGLEDEKVISFFEEYYSRLAGYDASIDVPVAIVRTSWSTDARAGKGSYVYAPAGISNAREDLHRLRQGMADRHVLFAGEHCADELQIGTVGGAFASGIQAAVKLASTELDGDDGGGGATTDTITS